MIEQTILGVVIDSNQSQSTIYKFHFFVPFVLGPPAHRFALGLVQFWLLSIMSLGMPPEFWCRGVLENGLELGFARFYNTKIWKIQYV